MSVEVSLYSSRPPISAKRLSEIARRAQIELRFLDPDGMPLHSSERIKRPLTRNGFVVIGWDRADGQTTAAVDRAVATRDKRLIDDLGSSGKLGWFEFSGSKFNYDRSWKRCADERSDFEGSIGADVLARMRVARAKYAFRCGLRPAHCGTLLGRVADLLRDATDAVDPEAPPATPSANSSSAAAAAETAAVAPNPIYDELEALARKKQADEMEMLAGLARANELDGTDRRVTTAFVLSALSGHIRAVQEFLLRGADKNAEFNGYTALGVACKCGHVEVVDLLLAQGVDIERPSRNKATPLLLACLGFQSCPAQEKQFRTIVTHLLNAGAGVAARDAIGQSPLSVVCSAYPPVTLQLVQLLVEHGHEIDVQDDSGGTPLMNAVAQGNAAVVQYLLTHNANPDLASKNGAALALAVKQDRLEIVEMLIAAGADVLQQVNGLSLADIARKSKAKQVAAHLKNLARKRKGD